MTYDTVAPGGISLGEISPALEALNAENDLIARFTELYDLPYSPVPADDGRGFVLSARIALEACAIASEYFEQEVRQLGEGNPERFRAMLSFGREVDASSIVTDGKPILSQIAQLTASAFISYHEAQG